MAGRRRAALVCSRGVMASPPPTVAADTRLWRHDTDLILRFYDDGLIADPSYYIPGKTCISPSPNTWQQTGIRSGPSQTFADRFGQHDEISGLRIVHDRIWLSGTKLTADRKRSFEELPERFRAWIGVRYRTDGDDREETRNQEKHGLWTEWTDGPGKPQENSRAGLSKPSVHYVHR